MIIALAGVVHSYDLLPYYFSHYRELGVEKFAIACNPQQLDPSGELKQTLVSQPDVEVLDLPCRFQRSNLVGMIEEEIRSRTSTARDWVIPADLDELNQYPGDLHDVIRQMERGGCSHIMGELRDRLALEGVLAGLMSFDQGISIWDQYPLEANVTARIAGGLTEKVLLSRGDFAWSIGHHRMRDSLRPLDSLGVAHHFKWRDGLAKTLRWRIENEERAKVPWLRESVQLVNYLRKHGRIIPEDVHATIGWRPQYA